MNRGLCGPSSPELDVHRSVCLMPFASNETVAIGDGTIGFCIPETMQWMRLAAVTAAVVTAGTGSGTTDIQLRRRRQASVADMLTKKLTLAVSTYSASNGVVDGNNNDTLTGDLFFVDVDAVNSTPPSGLSVTLTFVENRYSGRMS